ncbi:MAG: tyrosine--tRNA ligase [Proteobacteria bacterium]|nr:MAG: tyrosine--tRNA ligase [Pseudomonadota bacterium]
MKIIEELEWRGLIQDCSDREGINALSSERSFYIGYDPSAPSLQLGNLVPCIVSLHLARSGLKALQLFGGATGAIGDPSGKSAERPLLSREQIEANVANHKRTIQGIFERAGLKAEFIDNYSWTQGVGVLDFLREIGKHFTVNYMLSKEVVKARLDGEGISFTEFSYMLLQANDFLHLYKTMNCRLQIGGSDQWGNITAGLELIRKKGLSDAYALSIPLITDSQGKKFGKTEGGAIWLDAAYTSPFKFHQFWLNTSDEDAVKYLRIFTFLSKSEIENLESRLKSAPEKRECQRVLADSVTALVHGETAVNEAKKSAEVLFGGSLSGVGERQLQEIFSDVPSSSISRIQLSEMSVLDALVHSCLSKSKGEAKRLVASGGAYVNNNRITEGEAQLSSLAADYPNLIILRSGKKSYHLIKIE